MLGDIDRSSVILPRLLGNSQGYSGASDGSGFARSRLGPFGKFEDLPNPAEYVMGPVSSEYTEAKSSPRRARLQPKCLCNCICCNLCVLKCDASYCSKAISMLQSAIHTSFPVNHTGRCRILITIVVRYYAVEKAVTATQCTLTP